MKNQYLNELYYDLLLNTPSAVSMTIPDTLGNGIITQITTNKGVILSDWKFQYNSDMNLQGMNSDKYIQMIFCFENGIGWLKDNTSDSYQIKKGEAILYRGHGQVENTCYEKKIPFHFKSIKIPIEYFINILNEYFKSTELNIYKKKLLEEISKVEMTPLMERILVEMKDFSQYRGGLGHLFLESKTLELISVYLSKVLELDIVSSGKANISNSSRDIIMDVKRYIDNNIEYGITQKEIADEFHISVSKLSKDFTSFVGKPIHTYIIEQRIEKAAILLMTSDIPISQIAIMVGYNKASNFTQAFQKKYNQTPSSYRENRI